MLFRSPTDGYWRARPLTPEHLSSSGYGSSFLIGPVEVDDRPLVDLREVVFDPAARAFRLRFARGGAATLRVADVDRARIALDVSFDQPVRGRPFAALRSMFVAEDNTDTAWVAWRGTGAAPWRSLPILSFARAQAATVRAERIAPSRHNTAAPDVVFGAFSH